MKSFETYLSEGDQLVVESITYDQYLLGMNENLNEGKFKDYFTDKKNKIFARLKMDISRFISYTKLSLEEIKEAFHNNVVFGILKAFGFSLSLMFKSILGATELLRNGLLEVFKDLHQTKLGQVEKSGGKKTDAFLKKHPITKLLTGPIVAGLLLFVWLNMTFIGNAKYDLDFTDMKNALSGKFSVEKLFTSPKGLLLTGLFATGSIVSFPWLVVVEANLILALLYTGLKNSKMGSGLTKIKNKIKKKIKTSKKLK